MAPAPAQAMPDAHLREFNALLLAVYRLGRETPHSAFQAAVLEQIQTCIPFDSAWWGNAAAEPTEIHRLHLHNCDASILQDYEPYMEQDFFRAALIAQPGRTINMSNLTTRSRFVKTRLYQEVGKRHRIEWSLGTLLVEPVSSLYEFLTLWRHDARKPFSEAERQTKELLMPHLAEAHRNNLLSNMLSGAKGQSSLWAICDERGFLREATPGFIHHVRTHWPAWQGNCLPPDLHDALRSGTGYQSRGLRLAIVPKGAYRYVEVLPAGALHTLSPREREIGLLYASGETHAAIAAALVLSPATVRNHLARCYRKLSVNNKSELTLRIAGLRS